MKRLLNIFLIALGLTSIMMLSGCADDTYESDNADETYEPVVEEEGKNGYYADIVVIGGGASGMTAAAQAVYDGATNVVILEQAPFTGGIALQAFGGINAAESRYQLAEDEYGTVEEMIDWVMNPGVTHPELVRTMVENSADAIHWLNDFMDAGFTELMGNWAHRPDVGSMAPDNVGVGTVLVDSLNQSLIDNNIPVLLNTTANQILVDENGNVAGVVATRMGEEIVINTNVVILTAGPAGLDQDILIDFDAGVSGYGVVFTPDAQDTSWQLAYGAGAELTVALRPLAATGTQINYSLDLFENGAVLVNQEGALFVDVLDSTDREVVAAVRQQPENVFFVVFNGDVRDDVSSFEEYQTAELLVTADTIEQLAELIEVDADTLAESIDFAGPFYAGLGTAMAVDASAGVRINENAEVIGRNGNVITGLYASGQVVGGIQGYGRHGGSALMEVIVFGRIAGASATQFIDANFGHTPLTIPMSDQLIFAEDLAEAAAESNQTIYLGSLTNLEDGLFTGYGEGFIGSIYVQVVVEDGIITEIEITDHSETEMYMTMALDGVDGNLGMISQILEAQTDDGVDAVSGATASSIGIVEAVKNALGLE